LTSEDPAALNSGSEPAKSPTRSKAAWWLGSLALVLLLVPFLLPIPLVLERHLILRALGNQLHVALLAIMVLVLHRWGPWSGRLVAAALVTLVLGAGVELLQDLFGRHARWRDFGLDVIGIGLAIVWVRWWESRRPHWLAMGLLLLLTVPAQLSHLPLKMAAERAAADRFPHLSAFESREGRRLWDRTHGARVRFVRAAERPGRVLRLSGAPPSPYPGALLRGFPRDWRGYEHLEGVARAVRAPGDSVRFVVRLDDFASGRDDVWVAQRLTVGFSWRSFSIFLPALTTNQGTRSLRWDDVQAVLFYLPLPADSLAIELDSLRLR
jgi:hypothetical protein